MTVLDRVDMDTIAARAAQARPGMALLKALAALLYLAGWLPAKVLRALWMGTLWAGAAVAEGWADAWPARSPGDRT